MKLYIASRYERRGEMRLYADELEQLGHEVTATWLAENFNPKSKLSDYSSLELERMAVRDLHDIQRADGLVQFTDDPAKAYHRGGRHAEFGYALGRLNKYIYVVGEAEHIFHHHWGVKRFEHWLTAREYFGNKENFKYGK